MSTMRGAWIVAGGLLLLLPGYLVGTDPVRAGDEAKGEARGEAKKESRPVIDETKVYFGKAATCKAPAVIDADRVFRAIPEYRKILDRKLTDKDAEYSLLLLKANRKFRSAVEGAAKDARCDLVASVGAVTWEGHVVPDITEATLKKAAANP